MINTSFFKIGYASDLKNRFQDIYNAVPFELKIIYSKEFKEFIEIEKYIHNFFARKHYKGEWFELMAEDVYEIIHFLKKLENSGHIKREITSRLILQKKYKNRKKYAVQIGLTKYKEMRYNGYTKPKIYVGKNGLSFISFSIRIEENQSWKRFIWKCGINYEKDLSMRAVKAESIKNKIQRLLESGLNPISNKDAFREFGFRPR